MHWNFGHKIFGPKKQRKNTFGITLNESKGQRFWPNVYESLMCIIIQWNLQFSCSAWSISAHHIWRHPLFLSLFHSSPVLKKKINGKKKVNKTKWIFLNHVSKLYTDWAGNQVSQGKILSVICGMCASMHVSVSSCGYPGPLVCIGVHACETDFLIDDIRPAFNMAATRPQ